MAENLLRPLVDIVFSVLDHRQAGLVEPISDGKAFSRLDWATTVPVKRSRSLEQHPSVNGQVSQ